jgi:hypothetical protein
LKKSRINGSTGYPRQRNVCKKKVKKKLNLFFIVAFFLAFDIIREIIERRDVPNAPVPAGVYIRECPSFLCFDDTCVRQISECLFGDIFIAVDL